MTKDPNLYGPDARQGRGPIPKHGEEPEGCMGALGALPVVLCWWLAVLLGLWAWRVWA